MLTGPRAACPSGADPRAKQFASVWAKLPVSAWNKSWFLRCLWICDSYWAIHIMCAILILSQNVQWVKERGREEKKKKRKKERKFSTPHWREKWQEKHTEKNLVQNLEQRSRIVVRQADILLPQTVYITDLTCAVFRYIYSYYWHSITPCFDHPT